MNLGADLPPVAMFFTSIFLIMGATITFIGSIGLIRLRSFYERAHAPTLGTTLGASCIATASLVYFSALESQVILHELLIIVFIIVTTPVTLIILVKAALIRDLDETQKDDNPNNIER
jgi:multicomponent K+:H+ antiporter subunit G